MSKDIINNNERSLSIRTESIIKKMTEHMSDDERAKFYDLPEGCRIRESAKILALDNLTLGTNIWIGENTILDAQGGLSIGSHTTIGTGVFIWTHASFLANITYDNVQGSSKIMYKSTSIGSGCYIGGPSVIYPGVNIADRCIILPMTVVTEDVPANTMVGGSPSRIIKQIDDEFILKYKEIL